MVNGYIWYMIVKHLNTDQNDIMLSMQHLYVSHRGKNAFPTPLIKLLIYAIYRVCDHYFAYALAGRLLIALHIPPMVHYGCVREIPNGRFACETGPFIYSM